MTLGWAGIGGLVVVPALLIAAAPRRWLGRIMLLWLLSPVLAYAGVIAWEALTRPLVPSLARTALYGFMLVSAVVAVPWLAMCLAGFGIGFGFRRLTRRDPPVAAAAPPRETAPTAPSWLAVHVGFDHDDLRIEGVPVWAQPWRRTGESSPTLPHPAHPGQMHRFTVYETGTGSQRVRFAAAELSNTVWGFYVRSTAPGSVPPAPGDSHTSPDGSIRVDLEPVEWSNSHWVHCPRVVDLPRGRTVLDLWGTDWDATASFPGRRRVRLGLRRYRHRGGLTVDLDLDGDTYQIISEPGRDAPLPPAPLAEIAAGLNAATEWSDALLGPGRPPQSLAPHPLAAWRTALLILVVAIALIAGATAATQFFSPPQRTKLTPLPTMPGS